MRRLTISQPGRLDTLHWEGATVDGEALQDDEVQVEIHAAGLNFRVNNSLPIILKWQTY